MINDGLLSLYIDACAEFGCRKNSGFASQLQAADDSNSENGLQEINLNRNLIGAKGMLAVLRVVSKCENLSKLSFTNNMMTDATLQMMCNSLKPLNKIKEIDLSGNPISSGENLITLAKRNRSLTTIDTTGTELHDGFLKHISYQLSRNLKLKDDNRRDIEEGYSTHQREDIPSELLLRIQNQLDHKENPSSGMTLFCNKLNVNYRDPHKISTQFHNQIKRWRRPLSLWSEPVVFPVDMNDEWLPAIDVEDADKIQFILEVFQEIKSRTLFELISPTDYSEFGVHSVIYYDDRIRKYHFIDDLLPCGVDHRPGILSYGGDSDRDSDYYYWPILLLKSLLKVRSVPGQELHLSDVYNTRETPSDPSKIHAMWTGGVQITFSFMNSDTCSSDPTQQQQQQQQPGIDELWKLLRHTRNEVESFSSFGMVKWCDSVRKVGLKQGTTHAIKTVMEPPCGRILHLSNKTTPVRDRTTWKGKWSKNSYEWGQYDFKDGLDMNSDDFLMDFQDFQKYFTTCGVSFIPGRNFSSVSGTWYRSGQKKSRYWDSNMIFNLKVSVSGIVTILLMVKQSDACPMSMEIFEDNKPPVVVPSTCVHRIEYTDTTLLTISIRMCEGDNYYLLPSTYYDPLTSQGIPYEILYKGCELERVPQARGWLKKVLSSSCCTSDIGFVGATVPQYLLFIRHGDQATRVALKISIRNSSAEMEVGMTLCCIAFTEGETNHLFGSVPEDLITAIEPPVVGTTTQMDVHLPTGCYLIIPNISPGGISAELCLECWSTVGIELEQLPNLKISKIDSCWKRGHAGLSAVGNPVIKLSNCVSDCVFIHLTSGNSSCPVMYFDVLKSPPSQDGLYSLESIISRSPILPIDTYQRVNCDASTPSILYLVGHYCPPGVVATCRVTVACKANCSISLTEF